MHVYKDGPDVTPLKFFERGVWPASHDPLNFWAVNAYSSKMTFGIQGGDSCSYLAKMLLHLFVTLLLHSVHPVHLCLTNVKRHNFWHDWSTVGPQKLSICEAFISQIAVLDDWSMFINGSLFVAFFCWSAVWLITTQQNVCFVGCLQWVENMTEIFKLVCGFWLVCWPLWSSRKYSPRLVRMRRSLKNLIPTWVFQQLLTSMHIMLHMVVKFNGLN